MSRCASSFARNALHSTTITKETVCVIVDELETGLVENSSGMSLSNGKTNGIREPLTKRSSSHLDTWRVRDFGVSGSDAIDLLQKGEH